MKGLNSLQYIAIAVMAVAAVSPYFGWPAAVTAIFALAFLKAPDFSSLNPTKDGVDADIDELKRKVDVLMLQKGLRK